MAKRKTIKTGQRVSEFIDSIDDESKRKDSRSITELMAAATGEAPTMWGSSIVGFGTHHYTYANGKPAEICKVGFSPRARCIHIARLSDVDAEILSKMVRSAYRKGDGPC